MAKLVPFPRRPLRRVIVYDHGAGGAQCFAVDQRGRTLNHSRMFDSIREAEEAARLYTARTGLPLDPRVYSDRPEPRGPRAA